MIAAAVRSGGQAVEEFEALLEVTDVGEAFWTLGRSYDTLSKTLRRHGRLDLAEKLRQWRLQDSERVARAQGRVWQ